MQTIVHNPIKNTNWRTRKYPHLKKETQKYKKTWREKLKKNHLHGKTNYDRTDKQEGKLKEGHRGQKNINTK